jgi:heterotetrameric sarcosine oxidase gamma subunit
LWLSPRSWLLLCEVEREQELADRLNDASPEGLLHAALFTDQLCWFQACGSKAGEFLKRGGFISLERNGLPVGFAKRTLIANIPAVVIHDSEVDWLVSVERSRAQYFAAWIIQTSSQIEP